MKNMGSSKKMTILKMEFDLLATFQCRSKYKSKYDKFVDNRQVFPVLKAKQEFQSCALMTSSHSYYTWRKTWENV